jgi:hypothetical protein
LSTSEAVDWRKIFPGNKEPFKRIVEKLMSISLSRGAEDVGFWIYERVGVDYDLAILFGCRIRLLG